MERVNKTLQDRLVKEMRLEGIDTMREANEYLLKFIVQFNAKFGKEPANPTDLHRSLTELDQLDEILSWQDERTASHRLTVQYDRVVYLLEPTTLARDLQRKKVRVFDYPDGTVAIKYEGIDLPYSVFDKVRQVKQADIVLNKRLGSGLQIVKEQQRVKPVERSKSAPQRRGQKRICKESYGIVNPAASEIP